MEQVSRRGWRGIFHGCHPRLGTDAQDLVQSLGAAWVAQAFQEELGRRIEQDVLVETLHGVSIPEFAGIKQRALELALKRKL